MSRYSGFTTTCLGGGSGDGKPIEIEGPLLPPTAAACSPIYWKLGEDPETELEEEEEEERGILSGKEAGRQGL